MSAYYLNQKVDKELALEGKVKGIAYSGALIPQFGFTENFIVDIATTTIAKEKVPLLRDHNPGIVVGHGKAEIIDNRIELDGIISRKSSNGLDIIQLSEDGVEWEMSIGIFDGYMEEVENAEINGQTYEYANVLRNGIIREVSLVALGADKNTSSVIMNQKKGEHKTMKLTAEQYVKMACACGGDKDTTPEELLEKAEAQKLMTEEQAAEIEKLKSEIESLTAEVAAKQAEIEAIEEAAEIEEREEEISMAVKAKGIKLSAEKIKAAAKTKEGTEMILGVVEDMKQEGKIEAKLAGRVKVVEQDQEKFDKTNPAEIRLAAKQLIKDGKAKDMIDAISKLGAK